ncbi:MAG: alkylhydroperoxidase like protein AhpD family [Paenibacillus sp.]|nr:alkylhydroperoxidase like protein AhpD family [Paenibacillus sp.]
MKMRLNHYAANPDVYNAMKTFDETAKRLLNDDVLYELVKIRASQINGCAFCVDMHTRDARKAGESEQRLNLIVVWRESPVFTERERAALALTEAVTRISEAGVSQELYDETRNHFSEHEIASLLLSINAINSWNRIAITAGMFPGCLNK